MLDAFASLQLGIDSRGGGGCDCELAGHASRQVNWNGARIVPAAAAASTAGFLGSVSSLAGLRSRVSDRLLGGERERLSKRDFLGSGSVWSKRDRLVRRSESSMMAAMWGEEAMRGV